MHILLGNSIPIGDVDMAEQLFFKLVPQLYYPKMCMWYKHTQSHSHLTVCSQLGAIVELLFNWLWEYEWSPSQKLSYILPQLVHNKLWRCTRNYLRREKELPSHPNLERQQSLFVSCPDLRKNPKSWKLRVGLLHTQLKPLVVNALCSASFLGSAPSFLTFNRIRYKSTLYAIAKEGNCRDGSRSSPFWVHYSILGRS